MARPVILLLPGLASDAASVRKVFSHLIKLAEAKDWEVVAIDPAQRDVMFCSIRFPTGWFSYQDCAGVLISHILGDGCVDPQLRDDPLLSQLVVDAKILADKVKKLHAGVNPVFVVGHSQGGITASFSAIMEFWQTSVPLVVSSHGGYVRLAGFKDKKTTRSIGPPVLFTSEVGDKVIAPCAIDLSVKYYVEDADTMPKYVKFPNPAIKCPHGAEACTGNRISEHYPSLCEQEYIFGTMSKVLKVWPFPRGGPGRGDGGFGWYMIDDADKGP
jgi:hypothetical protein